MPELPSFVRTRNRPVYREPVTTIEYIKLKRRLRWQSYFLALNYAILILSLLF